MSEEITYLKLGPKANSFMDFNTGKKVLPGQYVPFTEKELASQKVETAIGAKHLVVVTDRELEAGKANHEAKKAEKAKEAKASTKEVTEKTSKKGNKAADEKDEILKALFDNYDFSDDEKAEISSYNLKELKAYAKSLEDGADD